ncbi:hypothetical protein PLESTF_001442600 [Pleodorina starrii]|nr:hypothetical protein PLESTF_001442600 [Pleodorina starrii]
MVPLHNRPYNDALVRKFPFANCGACKDDVSPYWMTPPMGPINATSSGETYCWEVRADGAVAGGSRCATMTIYKLEFIVGEYDETKGTEREKC